MDRSVQEFLGAEVGRAGDGDRAGQTEAAWRTNGGTDWEAGLAHRRAGHVVELEAAARVSPNRIAAAFGKALNRTVKAEIVPRADWERIFRAQGMKNPMPRMQMVDGFNEGWIDFRDQGAQSRKGLTGIDEVVSALVSKSGSEGE